MEGDTEELLCECGGIFAFLRIIEVSMVVTEVCRITGSYNRLSLFSQGARGVMARIASSDPKNPYQPTFPYRTEIFIILGREDLCSQLNLRIKNPHSKNIRPIFSPGCRHYQLPKILTFLKQIRHCSRTYSSQCKA